MLLLWKTAFCSLVLALIITSAQASTYRTAALGGESRLFTDETNIYLYPAASAEFSHVGVDLFGDWGGGVYPLSQNQFVGLFLNRPAAQLDRLNSYLSQNGSAAFRQLDATPWLDLFYAYKLTPRLHLGLAGRLAYDRLRLNELNVSAWQGDWRLGLRWGTQTGKIIDVTVGLTTHRFKDTSSEAPFTPISQTDGNGGLLDLRLRWPLSDQVKLVPSLKYESASYALAPDLQDLRSLELGLGLNAQPAADILVLFGLLTRYETTELTLPDQPTRNFSQWVAPALVGAGEVQVGSMVFRLGLHHQTVLSEEEEEQEELLKREDFRGDFKVNVGLGLEFGPLMIDGLLERDFLRDGPHIIGGSPNGGGIFSALSLTYRFYH
tara:strand:+ start:205 stop:1341 length:1137 start_codon:yes stop_codon:yes gene_type:complete